MESNVKIVERYKLKLTHHYGHAYNDITDIVDTVYVLNINGKDDYHQYNTREEAERAAVKYNKDNYLKELRAKADTQLKDLIRFRGSLSYLNTVYMTWKGSRVIPKELSYVGKNLIDSFNKDNPVLALLPPQEKHKCYIVLIKNCLKNSIKQYYKYKKEYLNTKKEIEKAKLSLK